MNNMISILAATLIAGILYAVVHLSNAWVFQLFEFTPHISLIYVPAFLRLANVLVLGYVWGTLGTMLGGIFLIFFSDTPFTEYFLNIFVSSLSGLCAFVLFTISFGRSINIKQGSDWFMLTIICAFSNTFLHHVLWLAFYPDQLKEASQFIKMILGDMAGTLVGAYLFRFFVIRFNWRMPQP